MNEAFAITHGDCSALGRARLALEGLSVGDAFGERFFGSPSIVESLIESKAVPAAPWHWTDDTAMALSIFEQLQERGGIEPDALALSFANRYRLDPRRGYGGTAHGILTAISLGAAWREAAGAVFDGQGSMGNGGGMRSAPIGGYFADDFEAAVAHARASAEPTHAHADGQTGAIAVAVAAALACKVARGACLRQDFLGEVAAWLPQGPTRDGIEKAATLPLAYDVRTAVAALGNGSGVISSDTIPFALWCAARHIDDFEQALWTTVSGLGDRDTTCAIVGGIVALSVGHSGIPRSFVEAREPLCSEADYLARHAEEVRIGRG